MEHGHAEASQQLRSNAQATEWVVAKFGGTSLGKFMVNIAEEIVPLVPHRGLLELSFQHRVGFRG